MDHIKKINKLKKQHNAVVLAHTYQPGEVQDEADFVGDSYGLSVKATTVEAETIIFCGVLFMAETAAILNPKRKVILPVTNAGCPMADMITAEELRELKQEYPDYTVICYVNSSAEVKAESDICCTSSNALKIVKQLPKGTGIIFVPDKHLGSYIQEQTGHEMILWEGFCPTHTRIKPEMIIKAKKEHPNACTMIHPEAPKECRDLCDQIFSTGQMCEFAQTDSHSEYIIGTELGILHTLKKQNPEKQFYSVSDVVTCPNMRMGSLDATLASLKGEGGLVVTVEKEIAEKAIVSLQRMLDMSK